MTLNNFSFENIIIKNELSYYDCPLIYTFYIKDDNNIYFCYTIDYLKSIIIPISEYKSNELLLNELLLNKISLNNFFKSVESCYLITINKFKNNKIEISNINYNELLDNEYIPKDDNLYFYLNE